MCLSNDPSTACSCTYRPGVQFYRTYTGMYMYMYMLVGF